MMCMHDVCLVVGLQGQHKGYTHVHAHTHTQHTQSIFLKNVKILSIANGAYQLLVHVLTTYHCLWQVQVNIITNVVKIQTNIQQLFMH